MKHGVKKLRVLACATAMFGCGDDNDKKDSQATHALDFMSWWTAPGEAEALSAMVSLHKRNHTDVVPSNSADTEEDWNVNVIARLDAAEAPDAFQADAFALGQFSTAVLPLTDLFATEGWDHDLMPEALETVTYHDAPRALPVGLHRENGLFYNKRIFELLNLSPPETFQDLMDVCHAIKSDPRTAGIAPLATSTEGWITRIVFQSIASMQLREEHGASAGAHAFDDYFNAKDATPDHQILRNAVDGLAEVYSECINSDYKSTSIGWKQAAAKLIDDPGLTNATAAMYIHGDWAKGFYQAKSWNQFGVVGAGEGLFLFGADSFAVPSAAPHREQAFSWLRTWGSLEGQLQFNLIKGSTVPRANVAASAFGTDTVALGIYNDMTNAAVRVGIPPWYSGGKESVAFTDWALGTTPNCNDGPCCDTVGEVYRCDEIAPPNSAEHPDSRTNEIETDDGLYEALLAAYPH